LCRRCTLLCRYLCRECCRRYHSRRRHCRCRRRRNGDIRCAAHRAEAAGAGTGCRRRARGTGRSQRHHRLAEKVAGWAVVAHIQRGVEGSVAHVAGIGHEAAADIGGRRPR
jgi:hypothetical protein